MAEGPMHAHNRQAAKDRSRFRTYHKPTDGDRFLTPETPAHMDCGGWEQIGRCVWCRCGHRLFQGSLPLRRREDP